MNLMHLPNVFSSVTETLLKLPQAKLAKLIGIALVIYIAYLMSKITWVFLDDPTPFNAEMTNFTVAEQQSPSQGYIASEIQSLNLFGIYNKAVVAVEEPDDIEDAPETNLNLTLTGVVASDDENLSAAIIENSGTQEVYSLNETITGTRAVLKQVHHDRVHIRHSGRLETLMLDGLNYEQSNKSTKANNKVNNNVSNETRAQYNENKRVDNRRNDNLRQQAQAFRNDLSENPGKITDYLKIGPKRKNGKIIGYQLRPGKNPEFFKSSGLKSGDVAIQINGYDLSQPSEAPLALKALKQEKEVSLLVNRNDDVTEILFSINN